MSRSVFIRSMHMQNCPYFLPAPRDSRRKWHTFRFYTEMYLHNIIDIIYSGCGEPIVIKNACFDANSKTLQIFSCTYVYKYVRKRRYIVYKLLSNYDLGIC